MKIYDIENFPNPLRVRIALAEKQATENITFIPIDVMAGEHRSDAFLAKNPMGTVPVLELDDGTYISESSAIIEYIDQHFSGKSLCGESAKDRAVIHMRQTQAQNMVLDAVATYFHHATDGLGPALEVYQCKEWGNKQKEQAISGFAFFDRILANQDYIVGEFSVADINLYAGLIFADFAAINVPEELGHLHAWRERMSQRVSIAG